MNRNNSFWKRFIEKLQPASQTFLQDELRKDWGLNIYFVHPFSSEEVTYASMLGRVLESSCERYPTLLSITRREEELYGSHFYTNVESFGEHLVIGFYLRALRDEYVSDTLSREVVEYISEILFSPHVEGEGFSAEIFEVEKERLLDAMASFKKDPMNLAYAGALKGCVEGELSLLPMEQAEVLEKMTPKSLYEYYLKLFANAPCHLVVKGMGNDASEGSIPLLAPFLPDFLPGADPVEKGDFAQSVMVQMYTTSLRAGDPDTLPLYLFTMLWGEGAFSRLFETVREEMGLCYGISADYSRSLSLVSVSVAFLQKEHTKLSDAIRDSLEILRKEGVSQDAFEGIKAEVRSSMISRKEGIGSEMSTVFYRSLLGESISIEERLKRLDNITQEEVLKAAQTLVYHSSFSILGGDL